MCERARVIAQKRQKVEPHELRLYFLLLINKENNDVVSAGFL